MKQGACGKRVMVDTKDGDSYDGELVGIDSFMNCRLTKVLITHAGDKLSFSKADETVFVRGNNVKGLRFPNELIVEH